MSERERSIRLRLRSSFPDYSERCLKIRSKAGRIEPFVLNTAQQHLHERIEEQKAKTGKVRALCLKARQQGISTYIAGRFYHRATHNRGIQVFILTHEQSATDNLFGMVDRYHANNNPLVKPSTGAANAKELYFDGLDSGYSVGTAGSKAVGRSKTIQLFHGSEAAFWPQAATHFAGVMQAVPDLPGTEIILESTANGIGGEFHQRWQQAENGEGDYIAIFIPWFWQPEYRRDATNFQPTEEERQYAHAYGLDMGQVAWMRAKRQELGDPLLFKQEYPANATEAFIASGTAQFIASDLAEEAARREPEWHLGVPTIIGVDPARFGDDETAIAVRRGRDARTLPWEAYQSQDLMFVAEKVQEAYYRHSADMVFVDETGIGAGVVDRLSQMGIPVIGVNFGASASKVMLPTGDLINVANKAAEMWAKMRSWLAAGAIPNDRALVMQLVNRQYGYDADSRIVLEKKSDMKKRGVKSPDRADALALTFAFPVQKNQGREDYVRPKQKNKRTGY